VHRSADVDFKLYRRVATEADPMKTGWLLGDAADTCRHRAEIVQAENAWWIGWGSLVLAGSSFVGTIIGTVPNAHRLGSA
jgi:hypothetical protein